MKLIGNSSEYPSMADSVIDYPNNTTNLDNLCDYYKLNKNDCIMTFSNYDFLKKYEHILRNYTTEFTMEKKYKYKPEYVSNDLYGSPDLWYLILFLNGCETHTKFNMDNNVLAIDPSNISILLELYNDDKNDIRNKENPTIINDDVLVKKICSKSEKIYDQKISFIKPYLPNNEINEQYEEWNNPVYDIYKEIYYRGGLNSSIDKISPTLTYKQPMNNQSQLNELSGRFYNNREKTLYIKPLCIGKLELNIDGKIYLFNNNEDFILNNSVVKKFEINKIINNKLVIENNDFAFETKNSVIFRFNFNSNLDDDSYIQIKSYYKNGYIHENKKSYGSNSSNKIIDILDIHPFQGNILKVEVDVSNIPLNKIIDVDLYEYDFEEKQIRLLAKTISDIKINYINNPRYNFLDICTYSVNEKNIDRFNNYDLLYNLDKGSLYGKSFSYVKALYSNTIYKRIIDTYDDMTSYSNKKILPSNKSVIIKKDFYMQFVNGKQYCIKGKNSQLINLFKEGSQIISKQSGKDISNIYSSNKTETVKISVEYLKEFGTEDNDWYSLMYRDNNNSNWKRVPDNSIYCKKIFENNGKIENNIIKLEDYNEGITTIKDIAFDIDSFEISFYVSSVYNGNNGTFGFMFKIDELDNYLLFAISYENQINENNNCFLNGLYYISNMENQLELNSNSMDMLKGRLIKETNEIFLSNSNIKPTFLRININNGFISVYRGISNDTLILEQSIQEYKIGSGYGFFIYNLDNLLIDEINIKYNE